MRSEKLKFEEHKKPPPNFEVSDDLLSRHEVSLMYLLIRRNREKARIFLEILERAAPPPAQKLV